MTEFETDASDALPFVLDGVRIEVRKLPAVPAMRLYLMADGYPEHSLEQADYLRLMQAPPYWAFCWGGGQALAQWVLANPERVRGRAVVDFGAGSGVAGIAAALAGARTVLCVDIDGDALVACQRNGALNQVAVNTALTLEPSGDALLLAADVCYEDEGFACVIKHIEAGGEAVVAESRRRDLSQRFPVLQKVAEYLVRTLPDLDESENYDRVCIFQSVQLAKKP